MSSVILDSDAISRAITRISYEIIEKNKGIDNLVLIGIQRRGVIMANRLSDKLYELEGKRLPVGILDITLYRDDLSKLTEHPVLRGTSIDFVIEGKKIVLVDDVLFTGRTVRAAIEAICELGRPDKIELAVMIDRGHRELPFRADYVGKNVPTAKTENVNVNFKELDEGDFVSIDK